MNSYISHIIEEIFHSTFFILIILTTLLLCVSTSTEEVFSISHSFDRKEILDAIEDWYRYTYPNPSLHPANISEIQQIVGTTLGDIRSVSYISDGKTLNVTLWLSKIKGQQTFSEF